MSNKLKAYMAFDGHSGPAEGATLVIAHNAREAKKLAWPDVCLWGAEYMDVRVRLLQDDHILALADQKKLAVGEPHVIDSPVVCDSCEFWGYAVDADGYCAYCDAYAGDLLVALHRDYAARQTAVAQEPQP